MKKLSTYSSSHTLRFPKVPQKLQKCQSIIISPSATSEKRRPVCRHVPSPTRERASERAPGTVPASQPRRGRGRIWTRQQPLCQIWTPAALAVTAISSDSRGPRDAEAAGHADQAPGTLSGGPAGVALGLEGGDNSSARSSFPCPGDPGMRPGRQR